MKFYLMRHGETLFNTQKRVQGWCDSPLTEKHDMTFDQYYCTTIERTSDTIELATGQT